MIDTLVVFGAGGDLTARLLLPALAALRAAGDLGPDFRLVGAGPQPWTPQEFAGHVRGRLGEHAPTLAADPIVAATHYRRADVTDPADVAAVLALAGPRPVAVYLALPTGLMLAAVRALGACGLPAGSRIAVEKPFGQDADGAAELNVALAELVDVAAYRVDHVLAMTAVRQLPDAPVPGGGWSSGAIEQLEVLWEETLALEGRASFYDRAGALRDVMQNHLVQVLCTVARADGTDAGRARADVLRAVRPLTAGDVPTHTRRARYVAGRLADGRAVPDYVAEDGVDPARGTETFAEVVLSLDTPRWTGTRVVLRAGKALAARRRGVRLRLRSGETVWLDVDAVTESGPLEAEPAAYQRILADVLGDGDAFGISAVEAELAWRVFTPVLQEWAAGAVPLLDYPAGSAGP